MKHDTLITLLLATVTPHRQSKSQILYIGLRPRTRWNRWFFDMFPSREIVAAMDGKRQNVGIFQMRSFGGKTADGVFQIHTNGVIYQFDTRHGSLRVPIRQANFYAPLEHSPNDYHVTAPRIGRITVTRRNRRTKGHRLTGTHVG